MSFRTDMLELEDALLDLQGPDVFDVATHQLAIVVRTWTSGMVGKKSTSPTPDYSDATTTLAQRYLVEEMSQREVASSGGRYRDGAVIVGPIAPWNGLSGADSTGYSAAQLRPTTSSQGVEIIYRLSAGASVAAGPLAGDYSLAEARFGDPFEYYLVLNRRFATP